MSYQIIDFDLNGSLIYTLICVNPCFVRTQEMGLGLIQQRQLLDLNLQQHPKSRKLGARNPLRI